MNRYSGELHWQELRHQLLHAWDGISDDDIDTLEQRYLRRSSHTRNARERSRRSLENDAADMDELAWRR